MGFTKADGDCGFCGKPMREHEQCPKCGYTECDKLVNGDHHLCTKNHATVKVLPKS